MKVQEAYRAQFFLHSIEKALIQIEKKFYNLSIFEQPLNEVLKNFLSSLFIELDQLLLPTVVYEFYEAKKTGFITGETPYEKYESFFVKDNKYTTHSLKIVDKYLFLFRLVDKLITITFESLSSCLSRYLDDEKEIKKWLSLAEKIKINSIQPLSGADRHCNQQAILIEYPTKLKLSISRLI